MSEHASAPPAPTFADKDALYAWLAKQAEYLVDGMNARLTPQANMVIGLGNVAALCFYEMNRFASSTAALQKLPVNWLGFYLLQGPGLLALGPFQGRPACTEIRVGKGVCGTAAADGATLVVPNVHEFPGHIACDSASESEVVVPILSASGSVVAIMDVDSTVRGFFDESDGRGLEAVARVVAQHLEFPMSRALAVNPALAMPSYSAVSGGLPPPSRNDSATEAKEAPAEPALDAPPPTRVSGGIPFFTVEAVQPETTCKVVRGWEFTTTRLDRIMKQEELQSMEKRLGISAFPEIQFPYNTLTITRGHGTAHKAEVLAFDVVSILNDAAHFYTSPYFTETVAPQLVMPVSESWANTAFDRHDPHVDWAWRHRYFGVPGDAGARVRPLERGMHGINWDLLKDRTLPIVFFDSFDFFEDDLHDHGMAVCSIKFRVMEKAFFLLFRQYVRVDNHELWLRDVRYYYEFDWEDSVEEGTAPYLVATEVFRKLSLRNAAETVDHSGSKLSIDELAEKSEVLASHEFYISLASEST